MPNESIGASDGAEVNAPHMHTLAAMAHHGTALFRPIDAFGHSVEELSDLARTRYKGGDFIVSPHSLESGLTLVRNAIRLRVHDSAGQLKQLIFDHNCRTNTGGTWQSILMGGDTNANLGYENHSGASTVTATTITPTSSPSWTINQWKGHFVVAPNGTGTTPTMTFGVIISNTATALTIDQWYTVASATGASLAAPANNTSFVILPGQSPAYWIGFTNDTATEDIGDATMTTEFTDGFTVVGRWKGVYAQTSVPSGTGTTNSNSVHTIDTGVLNANATKTIAKLGLYNAQNGGIMAFEKKLGTSASVIGNDTLDAKWTLTNS